MKIDKREKKMIF